MTDGATFDAVPPLLREALVARGFDALTTVQEAVLDPSLRGRDLRMSSQTGSGKTVAIGFVLFPALDPAVERAVRANDAPTCAPRALVITPTRELAAQVRTELEWLFERASIRLGLVIGGTSFGDEMRALRRGADIVVGTPGRLLDHLERGTVDPRDVGAVVLDEADQMLDLGFRDDLEAILEKLPKERRTHLVSATFSREVVDLATRYQDKPVAVQGTALGVANVDIKHVVHAIVASQRDDVLINLLLLAPKEPTLVFVRTRVDAAELADKLDSLGFSAASLTGDMEQRDRTRTLEAFRSGAVVVLVATDVAARGIDVTDVARVIHADPPGDSDVYTHRSGRTGRAGKKGTSIVLVPTAARSHAAHILRRARVVPVFEPAPSSEVVAKAIEARVVEELAAEGEGEGDRRLQALADALMQGRDPRTVVIKLLSRLRESIPTPREIAVIDASAPSRGMRDEPRRGERRDFRRDERSDPRFARTLPPPPERPAPATSAAVRPSGPGPAERALERAHRDLSAPAARPPPDARGGGYSRFVINWGAESGADPRRVMALMCRRGGIRGKDVGAIDIDDRESRVEVAREVAEEFAREVRRPDPRDPRIRIEPLWEERGGGGGDRPRRPAPGRHDRPTPRGPHTRPGRS